MSWRTLVSLAACAAAASIVSAAEKKIKKEDVPAPVLAAVAAQYPRAALKHFEQEPADDGKGVQYEVQIDDGGRIADVIVAPEGRILVEELEIAQKDLPPAVAKALAASKYGKGKVTTVEKLTEPGQADSRYEILVDGAGGKHELLFDAAGVLREDEKKGPGEDE
jgi:hypothetical protein